MVVLAIIGVVGALALGRVVFVPFAISIVLATALYPLVDRLVRLHVPTVVAAIVVVLSALLVLVLLGVALQEPAREMAAQAPQSLTKARGKLDSLRGRFGALTGSPAPQQSAKAAGASSAATGGPTAPTAPSAPPGTVSRALSITSSLLTEVVEEVLLVFFLLAAGNRWLEKLRRIAGASDRADVWTRIAGEMHDVVSRYLFVTLLINLAQAALIAGALWALGVPNPFLWGALTFVAEWVPYLGGLLMIGLLLVTGLAGQQSFAHAAVGPLVYLVVTTLQNNLVSPMAYGRGLRLNPTAILLSVMFWWMLWGVAGAFLAVPILASLRVAGAHLPSLEPLAIALEE